MFPVWPTQPGAGLPVPALEHEPLVRGGGTVHWPEPARMQASSCAPPPLQPGVVAEGSKSTQRKLPV